MPARPVSVDVVILDDTGQGDFQLQSSGVPLAQGYVLQFNNNQDGQYSDGFEVSLHLPAGQGCNGDWTFDDLPIWVKLIDSKGACPRNANDHQDGILGTPVLSNGNRTMTVMNSNATRQYFGFALRFRHTSSPGRTLTYDPIGDNQNGHNKLFSSNMLIYAAVGAATGVLSAIATTATLAALN